MSLEGISQMSIMVWLTNYKTLKLGKSRYFIIMDCDKKKPVFFFFFFFFQTVPNLPTEKL